jgi:hypothetical protein
MENMFRRSKLVLNVENMFSISALTRAILENVLQNVLQIELENDTTF